jgi:hypothetical protein
MEVKNMTDEPSLTDELLMVAAALCAAHDGKHELLKRLEGPARTLEVVDQ